MGTLEQNLLAGERIVFRTKKHVIVFFYPTLFALIAAYVTQYMASNPFLIKLEWLPMLAVLIFYAQVGLDYWMSEFAVTNKRVMMREGFFFRHANETRLTAISQINVYQSLIGQWLGYGAVIINAFGADDIFPTIAKPEAFKYQVNQQLDNSMK